MLTKEEGGTFVGGSIARKLAFLTMVGAGLVFLLIISYGYYRSVETYNKEFRARIANLGEATASKIRRIPRVAEAATADLVSVLRFFKPTPEQLPEIMQKLLEPHKEVSGIFVGYSKERKEPVLGNFCPFVFRDGTGYGYRDLAQSPGYDWTVQDWYALPLQLRKAVWTEPFFGSGKKGRIVVDYCIPLYDENWRYLATVGTSIELHWLTDMIAAMPIGDGGQVFLVTTNGTIVSHSNRERIMKETIFSIAETERNDALWAIARRMRDGEKGIEEYTDTATGEKQLIYYQPIEEMGWSLAIVFPEKQVLGGLARLSRDQVALGLLGMLGMLVMALFIARTISRPIRALDRASRVLASGDLQAPLPPSTGNDEVARLTTSFSAMRDSLLVHMEELRTSTAARERIASELDIACSIQMSLVPRTFPAFPERSDFDLFASLEPAREVGGDFYDFFMVDENHLLLIIGDVSGKGIPAALFMAVTRSFVKAFARRDTTLPGGSEGPAALLSDVNDEIALGNDACMFVTLFCAVVDLRDGRFRYASGGHNIPWILSGRGAAFLKPVSGALVGVFPGGFFEEGEGMLTPGDALFLYTDGVTEALDPKENILGEEQVQTWLTELTDLGSKDLIQEMRRRIARFADGTEQSDDITMLCFRYRGPSSGA